MSAGSDKRGGLVGWIADVSSNVVAGVVLVAIASVGGWILAKYPVAQDWFLGRQSIYRWAVIASVVVSLFIGFLVARWWSPSNRRSAEHKAQPNLSEQRIKIEEPDALCREIVRVLRFADGRWTTEETISKVLKVSSWQDLMEALRRLEERYWLQGHDDNYISREGARRYRLAGDGITFARAQGYKTLTEVNREEAEKKSLEDAGDNTGQI